MHCPTAVASATEAAAAVIAAYQENEAQRHRPVFAAWVGDQGVREARMLFARHHLPSYATPEQAVRAFMHLEHYRQNQALLMRVPPSGPEPAAPATAAVRQLTASALAAGHAWLNEAEGTQELSNNQTEK